ncbi:MAG: hypothetical protein IKG46_11190 [Solobacterium sp.]|nr:hypothetical protein [Solobacterium sp.]
MKLYRIIASLLLSMILGLNVCFVPASAESRYDDEVNEENALALLREYDPVGWEVVSFNIDNGHSSVEDWLIHADSNAYGLGTVMHEEYHMYTFYRNDYFIRENGDYIGSETIRLTNGLEFRIPYRNPGNTMFKTETYACTIPQDQRTFRFDTYVSNGTNTSANVNGIYGLIDEYAAYSWGLHTELCLYPFYRSSQIFIDLYNCGINDYQAYAEFRFWILGLLNYEKKYAPEYYEVHMNNIEWINAYCGITMQFREMIRQFEEYCAVMEDSKTWKPYSERLAEDRESRGIIMLNEVTSAPEYSEIEAELFRKCTISFSQEENTGRKLARRGTSSRHYRH